MDIDANANASVTVAKHDDTVAGMVSLVLLDEEGERIRIRPTGQSRLASGS